MLERALQFTRDQTQNVANLVKPGDPEPEYPEAAVRETLPSSFNWPLFVAALALMSTPVFDLSWRWWGDRPDPALAVAGSDRVTAGGRTSRL